MRAAAALAWSMALSATLGCSTLDRFDTKEGEAYCGNIAPGGIARQDFDVDLRLRMTLDTDQLSSVPGTLSTSPAKALPDTCVGEPVLQAAHMQVTEAMLHDPLSTFDFGMGRDYNFMAWTDSPCAGPVLAVVSLMKNDDVEVRLMKPPVPPPTGTAEPTPAGFALFKMTRQKNDCGF